MPYADRDMQRKFQRERLARNRREWLQQHGPCAECGSWDDLEVDHKDPKQKVAHRIWSWSPERRAVELAKCQVLCHPCHWKKTLEDGSRPRTQHGRVRMYRNGCRCVECRAAKSADNAKRRR